MTDRDAGRPSMRTPARRRVAPPLPSSYNVDDAERVERARARSGAVPEPVVMPVGTHGDMSFGTPGRTPVVMPFGKHTGTPVDQLPASYLCG